MLTGSNLLSFEAVAGKRYRAEAIDLFRQGYRAHLRREFVLAVQRYEKSLQVYAMPETYAFLGWTFSLMGNLEVAIEQCHKAIALDPEFGNPYNDIGAYMIANGQHMEAIPFLLQALETRRFRAYHYAYFNLGRAHELQGNILSALRYYKLALNHQPEYHTAQLAIQDLKSRSVLQESLI
jgi:tetratricopeptide (TPR) repeat protein